MSLLPDPNYDESRVPAYALPDALVTQGGGRVTTPDMWRAARRPELLELFRQHVYGRLELDVELEVEPLSGPMPCAGELGWRSELELKIWPKSGSGERALTIDVLLHVPRQRPLGAPVLIGLNLFGNHSLHPDPRIRLARGWLPQHEELGLSGHVATEASRGMHAQRWPVELVLSRGYALITAYAGDIEPDFDHGGTLGIRALLPAFERTRPDAPGALAAWAFGMSRLLDLVETRPELNAARAIAIGHSRLGKTALWAAAQDERFALAISNQSGCGGAALSRRCYGETLLHINQRFPHWFCPRFKSYNQREHELSIDQHQLIALLAPRPVYVASAALDRWADPHGEFLACVAASEVYALFGLEGLELSEEALAQSRSVGRHIGYHVRPGRHDITPRDFWHYLDFADQERKSNAN